MSDGWDHDRILCDCGRRALYGWPWCERCSGRYPGVFDQPVPLPADTELDQLGLKIGKKEVVEAQSQKVEAIFGRWDELLRRLAK